MIMSNGRNISINIYCRPRFLNNQYRRLSVIGEAKKNLFNLVTS